MQICMVTSAPLPPREGIGYYVWNLSRFLIGQGHQVQIITRGERGKPGWEKLEGIPIWRPRFYPTYPLHVHLHGLFVQHLVRRLETEVDVFHLHLPLAPAIRSKRPILVTAHTTRTGAGKIVRVTDWRSLFTRLQVPVSIQIEREVFASADQVVTVSQGVAIELEQYGLERKQVAVLGVGVNTDVFRPSEQGAPAPAGETYVLAAGRLNAGKGFEDLIKAMGRVVTQFPHARLSIAGAGPLEKRLKATIEHAALDDIVRLVGHVREQARMAELYRGATVFAHAAHYEGLPTVLLEAMACGKAVVSTTVNGALDAITDGGNGLLTLPKAPEQLAEAISRLLGDAGLRARLGRAARRTVEERFSWRVVGGKYLRSYRALVEKADSSA